MEFWFGDNKIGKKRLKEKAKIKWEKKFRLKLFISLKIIQISSLN
jgi:hypothetical protein